MNAIKSIISGTAYFVFVCAVTFFALILVVWWEISERIKPHEPEIK